MIAEDSRTIRGFIKRWLDEIPTIDVVATCTNGREALEQIVASGAEVVLLDIEMPETDGLQALPELVRRVPDLQVIMASTLTTRNAEISIQALSMGAADYIAKPESLSGVDSPRTFRHEIISKIRELGDAARLRRGELPPPALDRAATVRPAHGAGIQEISLRPMGHTPVDVLAIGSSTGGPQALQQLLTPLASNLRVPLLITQHMPPTFTGIMATHLKRQLGIECAEARDGEIIRPGRIYLAPGNRHMLVSRTEGASEIRITEDPPENFCRPAVDPLFRSVADVYGQGALCIVLTGMGVDGREGARAVVEKGGTVLAQDEASSVVWGMPGAVAMAGLSSAVDPLPDLSQRIASLLGGAGK